MQVALYRIAQESLNNVVKYARAGQVTMDLRMQPKGVRLIIADNGIGFDPDDVAGDHHGLSIMRERAEAIGARFAVHSEPGHGTIVSVTWNDAEHEES